MCIIGPASHRGLLARWQDTEVPSFGLSVKSQGQPLMLRNSRVGANSLVRPQWVIWAVSLAREKKQAFENSSNREQTGADTPWIGENHGELELKDLFAHQSLAGESPSLPYTDPASATEQQPLLRSAETSQTAGSTGRSLHGSLPLMSLLAFVQVLVMHGVIQKGPTALRYWVLF